MKAGRFSLSLFVSLGLFHVDYADVCRRQIRKGAVLEIKYYCCANYVFKEGTCEECPVGFTTDPEYTVSTVVGLISHDITCQKENFKSLVEFLVINLSSCNHIAGCVRVETEQHHTAEHTTSTAVYPVFLYKESIIYTGSVCLMACIICSLIAYICYKKNRKKKSFDKNKSNENPLVQWHNEHKNTDENEYAEIEDSFLSNNKTATKGVKIKDKEADNDTIHGHTADVMIGYLNPYQPIISSEMDVCQYSSTTNDGGNSTTADDNQRNFEYLNPYQTLTLDTQEKKHVYNELSNQDIEKARMME
ncbi:unnamed protein product [Mytilus edulis]|uniref:Uncharacterized protein n=1 Tax=Mytilus edulis TaxID=6550 RepID=A0A8S3TI39_MYTED|nr:unnamed protein product [Mytilus edulis]